MISAIKDLDFVDKLARQVREDNVIARNRLEDRSARGAISAVETARKALKDQMEELAEHRLKITGLEREVLHLKNKAAARRGRPQQ